LNFNCSSKQTGEYHEGRWKGSNRGEKIFRASRGTDGNPNAVKSFGDPFNVFPDRQKPVEGPVGGQIGGRFQKNYRRSPSMGFLVFREKRAPLFVIHGRGARRIPGKKKPKKKQKPLGLNRGDGFRAPIFWIRQRGAPPIPRAYFYPGGLGGSLPREKRGAFFFLGRSKDLGVEKAGFARGGGGIFFFFFRGRPGGGAKGFFGAGRTRARISAKKKKKKRGKKAWNPPGGARVPFPRPAVGGARRTSQRGKFDARRQHLGAFFGNPPHAITRKFTGHRGRGLRARKLDEKNFFFSFRLRPQKRGSGGGGGGGGGGLSQKKTRTGPLPPAPKKRGHPVASRFYSRLPSTGAWEVEGPWERGWFFSYGAGPVLNPWWRAPGLGARGGGG